MLVLEQLLPRPLHQRTNLSVVRILPNSSSCGSFYADWYYINKQTKEVLVMNTGEYWLKEILLSFQSEDEEIRREAWAHISKITGRNASSFHSVAEALACAYEGLVSDAEKEEFLRELRNLTMFSKKHKFSLETMDTIFLLVALLGKMDMFAESIARNLVIHWRNAGERAFLSARLLPLYEDCGQSPEIFWAVSYLQENKWIPRRHALDACSVLLGADPTRWFSTLARMLPVISRYKNKLLREGWESEIKEWKLAETLFLERIQSFDKKE
jgi:hypothetical protein